MDEKNMLAANWPAWPFYGLIDDLFPTLARWAQNHEEAAIATLVQISLGSSPRPLGSQMAISASGDIAGYVSGGCVEGAVAQQALQVMATGQPVLLDYGTGSPIIDIQLACGGRIGIFVQKISDLNAYVEQWRQARRERRPFPIDIDLTQADDKASQTGPPSPRIFKQSHTPPTRLLIAGGDPVTLALLELGATMGFDLSLLCPYGPANPPADIPLSYYDNRPLAKSLTNMAIDAWTAAYTLTHDFDADHLFLQHALQSPAFAVGVLGSRRKIEQRRQQLLASGVTQAQMAQLKTPAGLDIQARSPREIALSIVAEIIAERPALRATPTT